MSPGKLELLAAWLPGQPWYTGTGRAPELARAGGFRLDDPQGEVGIEFMAVTDLSGDHATTYHVPMTYRGTELNGADSALVGTSEHGVLGRRWVYDGAADPVLIEQLAALTQGEVQAQAQSVSDTPDTTVRCTPFRGGRVRVSGSPVLSSDASSTQIAMRAVAADGGESELAIRIIRLLSAVPGPRAPEHGRGEVSASWRLPEGTQDHGTFAEAWLR